MRKGLIALLVAAAAALLISGCAAKDEKVSHGDFKGETVTISTGDFYEACDKWTPGEKINFVFKSSEPVSFDVHYHQQHEKQYAIEQTVTDTFEGSIIVETKDVYCCMWQNDNKKYVTLTYDMSIEKQ